MCYPFRRGNRDLANSETYARCIPQFLGLRLEKIFHQGKGPTYSKYSLLLKHRHIYVYQKDREKKLLVFDAHFVVLLYNVCLLL